MAKGHDNAEQTSKFILLRYGNTLLESKVNLSSSQPGHLRKGFSNRISHSRLCTHLWLFLSDHKHALPSAFPFHRPTRHFEKMSNCTYEYSDCSSQTSRECHQKGKVQRDDGCKKTNLEVVLGYFLEGLPFLSYRVLHRTNTAAYSANLEQVH